MIILEFNRMADQTPTVYATPSAHSLISATSPSFQRPNKVDTVYPQRGHPDPPLRSGGRTHPLVLSRSPRTRQPSLDDRPSAYRTYITILSNGPHAFPWSLDPAKVRIPPKPPNGIHPDRHRSLARLWVVSLPPRNPFRISVALVPSVPVPARTTDFRKRQRVSRPSQPLRRHRGPH